MESILRPSLALGLLLATCGVCFGADAPAVTSVSLRTDPVQIVYDGSAIKPFLQAAASRRVDIAGIGDSNQIHSMTGWGEGMQRAFASRFGMYATGVIAAQPTGGFAITGPGYGAAGNPGFQDGSVAPAPLAKYSFGSTSGFNSGAGYLPPGSSVSNTAGIGGVYLSASSPFVPVTDHLRWHLTYGTLPGSTGALYPTVRNDRDRSINYATTPGGVSTGGTAYGLKQYTVDVPAGSRNGNGLIFRPWKYGGNDVQGPIFAAWQRVEDVPKTKGIAYSTLLYQGGKSAYHAAEALLTASDAALDQWVHRATELQNGPPMLMVQIMHGGNDRNYTIASAGPNPAPSNTPAGFQDNLAAIIGRFRQVWSSAGYDTHNLYFLLGPYHPQENAADLLPQYEHAEMSLADSTYNVAVERGTSLISPLTMKAAGFYYLNPDTKQIETAHLSAEGYDNYSRLAVQQLMTFDRAGLSSASAIAFAFDRALDVSTLAPSDIVLRNLDSHSVVDAGNISVWYDSGTNTLKFTFPGLPGAVLPPGNYAAKILAGSIWDSSAQPLPSDYSFNFTVDVPEPKNLAVLGILVVFANRRRRLAGSSR